MSAPLLHGMIHLGDNVRKQFEQMCEQMIASLIEGLIRDNSAGLLQASRRCVMLNELSAEFLDVGLSANQVGDRRQPFVLALYAQLLGRCLSHLGEQLYPISNLPDSWRRVIVKVLRGSALTLKGEPIQFGVFVKYEAESSSVIPILRQEVLSQGHQRLEEQQQVLLLLAALDQIDDLWSIIKEYRQQIKSFQS